MCRSGGVPLELSTILHERHVLFPAVALQQIVHQVGQSATDGLLSFNFFQENRASVNTTRPSTSALSEQAIHSAIVVFVVPLANCLTAVVLVVTKHIIGGTEEFPKKLSCAAVLILKDSNMQYGI